MRQNNYIYVGKMSPLCWLCLQECTPGAESPIPVDYEPMLIKNDRLDLLVGRIIKLVLQSTYLDKVKEQLVLHLLHNQQLRILAEEVGANCWVLRQVLFLRRGGAAVEKAVLW